MRPSAGRRDTAWAIATAVLLAPGCGGRPSVEARVRGVLEEAVRRANARDAAGLTALCAPDYADFEGRDAARTRQLLQDHFERYRGIVVHLLGARIGGTEPDGLLPVECDVSLSHGAAQVLRRLIHSAGVLYRFRLGLRPGPGDGWRIATAAWEEVGPAGLFPESLGVLKELFPGF